MPKKFALALVGSLIVVFSLGAGSVRADWVIDISGTLVEVDSIALGRAGATIALINFEPSQYTSEREARANQSYQESYNRYLQIQNQLATLSSSSSPVPAADGSSPDRSNVPSYSRPADREQTLTHEELLEQKRTGQLTRDDGSTPSEQELRTELQTAEEEYETRKQELDAIKAQAAAEVAEQRAQLQAEREKKLNEYITEARERKTALETREQEVHSEIIPGPGPGNTLSVKQEVRDRNGQVQKTSQQVLPPGEGLTVELPETSDSPVIISASDEQELEIQGERTRTRTNFPITIGENNQLMITSPDGEVKPLGILPDAAIENLEARGFTVEPNVNLGVREGRPVYNVTGEGSVNILGLRLGNWITNNRNFTIDAETGELIASERIQKMPFFPLLWKRLSALFGNDNSAPTE